MKVDYEVPLWFDLYYPYEDQLICSMEEDACWVMAKNDILTNNARPKTKVF